MGQWVHRQDYKYRDLIKKGGGIQPYCVFAFMCDTSYPTILDPFSSILLDGFICPASNTTVMYIDPCQVLIRSKV